MSFKLTLTMVDGGEMTMGFTSKVERNNILSVIKAYIAEGRGGDIVNARSEEQNHHQAKGGIIALGWKDEDNKSS